MNRKLKPNTRVVDVLEVWSRLSGWAVIGTGCIALLPHGAKLFRLCCPVFLQPVFAFNTATANILTGTALLLLTSSSTSMARRNTGRICAALVAIASAFVLCTHFLAPAGLTTHMPAAMKEMVLRPFHLGVPDAVGFFLIGSALLLIDVERKGIAIAQALTLPVVLVSLLPLLQHVYHPHTGQSSDIRAAAIQSGLVFFLVSTSVLFLRPQWEPMRTVASQSPGGAMLRRALPATTALLIIGGWVRINGEKIGLFDTETGTAIFAILIAVMAIPLLWLRARLINRVEAERLCAVNKIREMNAELEKRVEERTSQLASVNQALREEIAGRKLAIEALRASEQGYQFLFESNPLPLFVFDHETYGYTAVNQAALDMYGYTRDEFFQATAHDLLLPQEITRLSAYLKETTVGHNNAGIWRSMKKDGTVIETEVYHHVVLHEGRPSSLLLVLDVTERRKTEIALQEYATRLRILSQQLLNVQEAERSRIARELHDQIGQTLTAVKFQLQSLRKSVDKAVPKRRLEDCIHLSGQAMEQVRTLSLDLRPPVLDELGLTAALEAHVKSFAYRATLSAKFAAGNMTVRPAKETEIACFRVTQEALTNVMRHAKACRVSVRLHQSGHMLGLEIKDDGVGFDLEATRHHALAGKSIGLLSMAERVTLVGGQFHICSRPGRGTVLRAEFPLGGRDANSNGIEGKM
ncbi:MAG: histidine kinase [Noviherbaspirillum sp.]